MSAFATPNRREKREGEWEKGGGYSCFDWDEVEYAFDRIDCPGISGMLLVDLSYVFPLCG